MFGVLGSFALRYIGPRAFKAVTGAITTGGAAAMASCNVEDIVTQVLTTGVAGLAGYIATYLVPNKQ